MATRPENPFTSAHFHRVAGMTWRQPSIGMRLLASVILFVMIIIGLLVVAVGLVIGIPLALVAFAYLWIKAKIRSLRAPNGPMDGRENVRVMQRRT